MFIKRIAAILSAGFVLSAVLIGCGDNAPPKQQAPISPDVLASAASFLGAATGKEYPINTDSIVFVNSVLGINDVEDNPRDLYGDLWVVVRDAYGAPILDDQGCNQPVASEPVEWPDGTTHDTVPMTLEEFMDGQFKCGVVEGYEQYTIPLEIGRLNMVRSSVNNPNVFARAFEEVMKNINAARAVKTDVAGRLVLVMDQEVTDDVTGEITTVTVEKTIDAPRDNLAMYKALLVEGRLAGYGVEKTGEEGETIPAPWLEIRPDLDLGELAYLRDGTPGRDKGVDLIKGYADLSRMRHSTEGEYQGKIVSYVQYVDDEDCHYEDRQADAWERIFAGETYQGENMEAFTRRTDDTRRVIVFTHDVIQDAPETALATLPGDRLVNNVQHQSQLDTQVQQPIRHRLMETAASFLGAASNKGVPLKVDGLVFMNTVLGLNEVDFAHQGEIYGDLWELERDAYGVPLLDGNNCPQPISSQPGLEWPDGSTSDYVPMEVDETGECIIVEGYEEYVVEIELGRLNCIRTALTNPRVLQHHLYEAVKTINASQGIKLDQAGRLAYTVLDDAGNPVDKTIDSPRANTALYWALMEWGKLEGPVEVMIDGSWTTVNLELDETKLGELGFLKRGDETCQDVDGNPMEQCPGAPRLGNGYVDFSWFQHSSQADYSGIDVSYVERILDPEAACGYVDRTGDIWETVLKGDTKVYGNIAAFVKQAEDARHIIKFNHTKIQDESAPASDH